MTYIWGDIEEILPKFNRFLHYFRKELESEDFQKYADELLNYEKKDEKVIQFLIFMIIRKYNLNGLDHFTSQLQCQREKFFGRDSVDFSIYDQYFDIGLELGIELKYINGQGYVDQLKSIHSQLERFGREYDGSELNVPIGIIYHNLSDYGFDPEIGNCDSFKKKEYGLNPKEKYDLRKEKLYEVFNGIEGDETVYLLLRLTDIIYVNEDYNKGYAFDIIIPQDYFYRFKTSPLYLSGNIDNIINIIDNYLPEGSSPTRRYQIEQINSHNSNREYSKYIINDDINLILNLYKNLYENGEENLLEGIEFLSGSKKIIQEIKTIQKHYN